MNSTSAGSGGPPRGPQFDNRRIAAGLIDVAIVVAVALVVSFVVGFIAGSGKEPSSAMPLLLLAWGLFYYFALESGNGQTLGKRIMNLRVLTVDGRQANMGEIGVRTVLRIIDGIGLYLVGLITMMATGQRRQRLGDLAAKTIVTSADWKPVAGTRTAASTTSAIVLPTTAPAAGPELPTASIPSPFTPLATESPSPAPDAPPSVVESPSVTGDAPSVTPDEPAVVAEPLSATPDPQVVAAELPFVTPEPPAVVVDPPSATPEEPVVVAEPPSVTPDPPVVAQEGPFVMAEPPAVTVEPSSVTPDEPSAVAESPFVAVEQPGATPEASSPFVEPPSVTVDPPSVMSEEPTVVAESPFVSPEPPAVTVDPADEAAIPPVWAPTPTPATDSVEDAAPIKDPIVDGPADGTWEPLPTPVAESPEPASTNGFAVSEPATSDEPEADDQEEPVRVRSVETMSAMDMLMSELEEDEPAGHRPAS